MSCSSLPPPRAAAHRGLSRRLLECASLQEVRSALAAQPIDNAFAELAQQALQAASDSEAHAPHKLAAPGGLGEFLTRVLRNGIDQEAARAEHGLTVLAYNAFNRRNRMWLARLDAFAHDVYVLTTVGAPARRS